MEDSADDFTRQATVFWQERGGRMTVVRNIICRSIASRHSGTCENHGGASQGEVVS
jgi:hypothetical protein